MKRKKNNNHVNEWVEKNWLGEMRQILTSSNRVDKMIQERIAEHTHSCSLVMDNVQINTLFMLLDARNMEYLFVSRSTQTVLGFNRDEIIKNGFQWLFTLLSPVELTYKKTVVEDIFNFLKTLSREKIMNSTVKYDIVCHRKDGKKVHLLEELMFPEVNEHGDPVLISCFLHDISDYVDPEKRQCHIYLNSHEGSEMIFSKNYCVTEKKRGPLSHRELQVLEHFSNGLTTTEVAKNLFITLNTVKTHRKNILSKLDVHNTSEAVKFCIKNKWIA
ncbi:MAG: LuxR C-terminal-related transcriptional regulator [Ferruginibacter sp.]